MGTKKMREYSKDQPLVYIVILNYNAFGLTTECLRSLGQLTYSNYHMLVVDDGSLDDSADKIVESFPEITLIRNRKNLNYCKSFNVGIREALRNGARYIFLVNNDTKDFSPNYLEEIVQAFEENSKVGLVGSRCYDYGRGVRWKGVAKDKFGIPMETPTEGYVIKREVFEKIGLLDEKLVIYFEDLDFIVRLRKAGYVTKAVFSVSFAHLGGGTTSRQLFVPNYYRVRNLIWFMKRYCADKPFSWKIMNFMIGLEVHVRRLGNSFINLDFKSFIILSYSIALGLIKGFITKWDGENE